MTIAIVSNSRWPTPRAISERLEARHIRLNRPFVARRRADLIVNWGCADLADYRDWARGGRLLNPPAAIRVTANKLTTFRKMTEARIPTLDYTEESVEASRWLRERASVVGHFNLSAHSGQGLTVFRREQPERANSPDFRRCRVFTRFFPRDREFRVHVFKNPQGEFETFVNEKKRAAAARQQADFGREQADYYVRNHANGWVYVREVPAADARRVSDLACRAAEAIGLTFGAVDIFWKNGPRGGAPDLKVCEVNSAPGLTGVAQDFYVQQITRHHEAIARVAAPARRRAA